MVARLRSLGLAALVACSAAPAPQLPKPTELDAPPGEPLPSAPVAVVAHAELPPPRELRLFMMSHCPYAVFMIQQVAPILKELGERVRLRVDFIGSQREGVLTSMFKEEGVAGDIAMRCVAEHSERWLEIFACQGKDRLNAVKNWRECGAKLGLPVDRVQQCIDSGEGRALLSDSYDAAKAAGAKGSPTLMIDGVIYNGARRVRALRAAFCEGLGAPRPVACEGVARATEVTVQLLTDSRCSDCTLEPLEKLLRAKLESPVFGPPLDYATPEGRAAFVGVQPAKLPLAIFDASLDPDPDAPAAFGNSLKTSPSGVRFVTKGSWNPICADAGGCSLDECKGTLVCRTERPRTLELAFMSKCPFYAKGIVALKETIDQLRKHGETLSLRVETIGGTKDGKFIAMHGVPELEENLRHLCVAKKYAANLKFLDYFVCRAQDQASDAWEACTGGKTGFDAKLIRTCAEGTEGKALLGASYARLEAAGLTSSPTWVVNDKFKYSPKEAPRLLDVICKHNRLKSCAVAPSSSAAVPAQANP